MDKCSICLDDMNDGCCFTACFHLFHTKCLTAFSKTQLFIQDPRCPICKARWYSLGRCAQSFEFLDAKKLTPEEYKIQIDLIVQEAKNHTSKEILEALRNGKDFPLIFSSFKK